MERDDDDLLTMSNNDTALPPLTFFEKPDLWKYGHSEEGILELDLALASFENFSVVDAATEQHRAKLCMLVDPACSKARWSLLHTLMAAKSHLGKATALVRSLLQLGVDPDAANADGIGLTPSFRCAYRMTSAEIAKVLVICRPNLRAKDNHGNTAAVAARKQGHIHVARVFEDVETNGFPPIAQLAQEGKWWAVHNLCRRGIVPNLEKFALYKGKDAIGWAKHHKQFHVVEELEYLLKGVVKSKNGGHEDQLVSLKEAELKKSEAEKEVMKNQLEEQAKELMQLKVDQALLKKDKEMLLVNIAKANEDNEELQKELAALKEDFKRKIDSQEKKDQEFEQQKRMKINSMTDALDQEGNGEKAAGVVPNAGSEAAAAAADGNEEDQMAASTLKAENAALKKRVGQLKDTLKAQSELLNSLLEEDT